MSSKFLLICSWKFLKYVIEKNLRREPCQNFLKTFYDVENAFRVSINFLLEISSGIPFWKIISLKSFQGFPRRSSFTDSFRNFYKNSSIDTFSLFFRNSVRNSCRNSSKSPFKYRSKHSAGIIEI